MTNEEFQIIVLQEFKDIKGRLGTMEGRMGSMEGRMGIV